MLIRQIYQNDHINIVHDACKLCYLGKPETTYEKRLKYIQDKVKDKHESVLEHSNVILQIVNDEPFSVQDAIQYSHINKSLAHCISHCSCITLALLIVSLERVLIISLVVGVAIIVK